MPRSGDEYRVWEPGVTYVIGHQRPDTDAIASALGYTWYLAATGEPRVRAARAGQPAPQTLFALERFGQAPPRLLAGVAPTFHHIAEPQPSLAPEAPLSEVLARLALGERVVPLADEDGKPAGVVTTSAVARELAAITGDPACLGNPCVGLAQKVPWFHQWERVSDHRSAVLRSETDDFLVVDDDDRYEGIAARRRVLEPPRARLILVDHNELSQAVAGAEEAEIAGVLDHHRLGNAGTAAPIPFVVDPVGSTSTLVAERCCGRDLEPPPGLAGLLLSGILSDTLVFRSPTTTDRDRKIAAWLAALCSVDPQAYGEELLRASPGLTLPPGEIVDGDRKAYRMGGQPVSIAQVEVTSLAELPQHRDALLEALEERRQREGLALMALMVTDVVLARSRLLARGERRLVIALPFPRSSDAEFDLGGMVSRKKQLVPALETALDESG